MALRPTSAMTSVWSSISEIGFCSTTLMSEAAGCMKDDIERYVVVRHLDRAQKVFRVIDVDVTHEREAEKPHRFLPVHQQDHTGISLLFQLGDLARTHRLEH